MSKVTTIQLHKQTREILKKHGLKGETYDQIIKRLLNKVSQPASTGQQQKHNQLEMAEVLVTE